MIFAKDKVLLGMKFCSALFLIFMLFRGVNIFILMKEETETVVLNNSLCDNYFLFHIFAFVLGAIWNVKRIIKIGII
jgi:hypothetical protein